MNIENAGQWASVGAAVIAFLTMNKQRANESSDLRERISKLEEKSDTNRINFTTHEDMHTQQTEVLIEIRTDVRENRSKLESIEQRLDRDFQRQMKG